MQLPSAPICAQGKERDRGAKFYGVPGLWSISPLSSELGQPQSEYSVQQSVQCASWKQQSRYLESEGAFIPKDRQFYC
jgi:hypothetical protein